MLFCLWVGEGVKSTGRKWIDFKTEEEMKTLERGEGGLRDQICILQFGCLFSAESGQRSVMSSGVQA